MTPPTEDNDMTTFLWTRLVDELVHENDHLRSLALRLRKALAGQVDARPGTVLRIADELLRDPEVQAL